MAKTKAQGSVNTLSAIDGRTAAIGAAVLAVGAGIGVALFSGWGRGLRGSEPLVEPQPATDGPVPDDTAPQDPGALPAAYPVADIGVSAPAHERAPDEFRPDRDAPVAEEKRAAFAPAIMPVPDRVEAMGDGTD